LAPNPSGGGSDNTNIHIGPIYIYEPGGHGGRGGGGGGKAIVLSVATVYFSQYKQYFVL